VASNLENIPWDGSVQQQTDRLMVAVTEAVYGLTPKAKPSPYAKRWWTTDLTRLRRTYTFWRNQAEPLSSRVQANNIALQPNIGFIRCLSLGNTICVATHSAPSRTTVSLGYRF
jgi:hypothetical protein